MQVKTHLLDQVRSVLNPQVTHSTLKSRGDVATVSSVNGEHG